MEWRLATFTYQNAREITRVSLSLARQSAIKGKDGGERLKGYSAGLFDLLQAPVAKWTSELGELEPGKPDTA